jgi:hypothetical protein
MNSAGSSQGWQTSVAGSGTVSANSGVANAVAYYPAAGGATTVTPANLLYNGSTGMLTIGGSGTGTATLTAPATGTGPLVFGNVIQTPNNTSGSNCGAANVSNGSGAISSGMIFYGSTMTFCSGNSAVLYAATSSNNSMLQMPGLTGGNPFISFFNNTGVPDTSIGRTGQGIVGAGSSNAPGEGGYFRSANSCTITASQAFATNLCSQTLPGTIAGTSGTKPWIVRCTIPWNFSAGSGAATVTMGVNLGTAPSASTYFTERLWNPTGASSNSGATIVSASGQTVLITTSSLTINLADVYIAELEGVIVAPAAGIAFNVYASTTGGTGQYLTGANCRFE